MPHCIIFALHKSNVAQDNLLLRLQSIAPAKSYTANTTVRTANTPKRASRSVQKSYCHLMPQTFSDREALWSKVAKVEWERKRSLHTALTLLCRTSFHAGEHRVCKAIFIGAVMEHKFLL